MVKLAAGVESTDSTNPTELDVIKVGEPSFTVAGTKIPYHNIHTFGVNTGFSITAPIEEDPENYLTEGMRINFILLEVEYNADGTYEIISSPRIMGHITGGQIVLAVQKGLPKSGNYLISSDRQNQGIAYLGLPFRIEFEDIEIDVCLNL